jgi:uncharacterized protein (UPF0548 family)
MLLLRKPEPYLIRQYLDNLLTTGFSYPEVGATNGQLPKGYAINHTRKKLGQGQLAFDSACDALRSWQQLQLGWVDCWPRNAALVPGEQIAVIGRAFGLWWLNACRVAYVIDEREHQARFGYAHGTLPDHLAIGEERFLVEMSDDQAVWIDILAFSRPNTAVARIGYPMMRRAQSRFGRESAQRLVQAVQANLVSPQQTASRNELVAASL